MNILQKTIISSSIIFGSSLLGGTVAIEAEVGAGSIAESGASYRLLKAKDLSGLSGAVSEKVLAPEFDVDSLDNAELNHLNYRLNFKSEGTYELWLRCAITSNKEFSFGGGLDAKGGFDNDSIFVLKTLDAKPSSANSYKRLNGLASLAKKNVFVWLKVPHEYEVQATGWHSFAMIGSEDGFLIDGIAFVQSGATLSDDDLDAALVGSQ